MSTLPDSPTTLKTSQATLAPPSPPLFSVRHWLVYGVATILVLLGFVWALHAFRNAIDNYQQGLPRYAAERAIKALDAGHSDQAVKEVQLLMDDVPIQRTGGFFNRGLDEVWEGRVLRNRVTPLAELTGRLLGANMPEQAESVGWKMMLECHISSRVLEYIHLWEWMLYVKAIRRDALSSFEILRILAAHGMPRLREPGQIEPNPVKVDPEIYKDVPVTITPALVTGLAQYFQSDTPEEFGEVAGRLLHSRDASKIPAIRQKLAGMVHQSLIRAARPAEAHAFFAKVWGNDLKVMDSFWRNWPQQPGAVNLLDRDPTLLDLMWHDRPSSATLTLTGFLDTFRFGDPRIRVIDFSKMTRKDIGYFNLNNKVAPVGDRVVLSQAVAARMQVLVTRTVHRVYIAYDSTQALGIRPILLVRINDEPYIPLYCDSEQPDLAYFDTKLESGTYDFEFVYLNDASFAFPAKGIKEDRNLNLYRMALVQVPPSSE